jgi:hypothetical protein
VLRPSKRPAGTENALILKRVVKRRRAHGPQTPLVIRGDSHFANPQLMTWAVEDPHLDFLFGLATNAVLKRLAEPTLQAARERHETRTENAARAESTPPPKTGLYTELDSAAGSWPQSFRVILKTEATAHGDNPPFVVTSLEAPTHRLRPAGSVTLASTAKKGQFLPFPPRLGVTFPIHSLCLLVIILIGTQFV